jgi:hypothetical protein
MRFRISVLRKKSFFPIFKFSIESRNFSKVAYITISTQNCSACRFHSPTMGEKGQGTPLEKVTFFWHLFSPEWNRQPAFNFNMGPDVRFLFRLIPWALGFLGYIANFRAAPISRFFTANLSVHQPIGHKSACFLVRNASYAMNCVVCLSSEKKVIFCKIMHLNFSNFEIFDRIWKFFKPRRKVNHCVLNSSLGHETNQKPPKSQAWGMTPIKSHLKVKREANCRIT